MKTQKIVNIKIYMKIVNQYKFNINHLDSNLDKEIKKFEETSGYMKNEIKLIKLVDKLLEENNYYQDLKKNIDDRDLIENFSASQLNKIKELLKF